MNDDLFSWEPPPKPQRPSMVPLEVCTLFEKLALDIHRAGWGKYSARAILHRIRWHKHIEVGDRDFKCNNNWTPALSRWFMELHPECGGFFETRSSPTTPGHTPDHGMDDYMGPYK